MSDWARSAKITGKFESISVAVYCAFHMIENNLIEKKKSLESLNWQHRV